MKKHTFCAYLLFVSVFVFLAAGIVQAYSPTPYTWDPPAGGINLWSLASNWGSSGVPDTYYEQAIFGTKGTTTDPLLNVDLNSSFTGGLGQLLFNAAGWTINSTGHTINFNSAVFYGNNAIYSYGAGTNTISSNVEFHIGDQRVSTGTGNTLVLDQISGPHAFVVNSTSPASSDTGKIKLTGNNSTLTDPFFIRMGTLLVANNGALGSSNGTIYLYEDISGAGAYAKLLTDGAYTVSKNIEVRSPTNPLGNPITINAVLGGNQTVGASQFTGTVKLNQTATLAAEGSSTVSFTNTISGAGGIKKTGTGTVVLAHSNTYEGATTISRGVIQTNASGALPNWTDVTINSGATLDLNGYTQWISSLSGRGGLFGNSIIALGNAQLYVESGNYYGEISGIGGSVLKYDIGTLALSGTNSYTGQTYVNYGTLLVNGTHNGGGLYTVDDEDATLGGTGTIHANVRILNGGILSPGTSDSMSHSALNISGNTSLAGTLKIEIGINSKLGIVDWDLLNNTGGNLNITNGTLDFDISCVLSNPAYVFANYSTLTGSQFANVIDLPSGYFINYNYLNNNQIALVVIPEPATMLLLSIGACIIRKKLKS
jgi:autotransporter-associated beta strand protein